MPSLHVAHTPYFLILTPRTWTPSLQVDLAESMSVAVEAGMEKLSASFMGLALQQQPGMAPGRVLQGLAAQLLERTQTVTQMVKVSCRMHCCLRVHRPAASISGQRV